MRMNYDADETFDTHEKFFWATGFSIKNKREARGVAEKAKKTETKGRKETPSNC